MTYLTLQTASPFVTSEECWMFWNSSSQYVWYQTKPYQAILSHIRPHLAILSLSTENCWCPSDWAKPPGASLFDRRCCQCKYRRHRILLRRACWSSQICMACWIVVHQRLKSYHKRSQAFTTWGLCPGTISFLLANHMYKLSNHWTCSQQILRQKEIATW